MDTTNSLTPDPLDINFNQCVSAFNGLKKAKLGDFHHVNNDGSIGFTHVDKFWFGFIHRTHEYCDGRYYYKGLFNAIGAISERCKDLSSKLLPKIIRVVSGEDLKTLHEKFTRLNKSAKGALGHMESIAKQELQKNDNYDYFKIHYADKYSASIKDIRDELGVVECAIADKSSVFELNLLRTSQFGNSILSQDPTPQQSTAILPIETNTEPSEHNIITPIKLSESAVERVISTRTPPALLPPKDTASPTKIGAEKRPNLAIIHTTSQQVTDFKQEYKHFGIELLKIASKDENERSPNEKKLLNDNPNPLKDAKVKFMGNQPSKKLSELEEETQQYAEAKSEYIQFYEKYEQAFNKRKETAKSNIQPQLRPVPAFNSLEGNISAIRPMSRGDGRGAPPPPGARGGRGVPPPPSGRPTKSAGHAPLNLTISELSESKIGPQVAYASILEVLKNKETEYLNCREKLQKTLLFPESKECNSEILKAAIDIYRLELELLRENPYKEKREKRAESGNSEKKIVVTSVNQLLKAYNKAQSIFTTSESNYEKAAGNLNEADKTKSVEAEEKFKDAKKSLENNWNTLCKAFAELEKAVTLSPDDKTEIKTQIQLHRQKLTDKKTKLQEFQIALQDLPAPFTAKPLVMKNVTVKSRETLARSESAPSPILRPEGAIRPLVNIRGNRGSFQIALGQERPSAVVNNAPPVVATRFGNRPLPSLPTKDS